MIKPPPFAKLQHFHAGKKGKLMGKMIQIKIEVSSSEKHPLRPLRRSGVHIVTKMCPYVILI
jgi:hypothetical protein